MKRPFNFLLAGVGGQGTILASSILAHVGVAAGYQVKQAEVHGMSQRGGSVTGYVRWGEVVYSPLVGAGEVDVLLAFEKLEALRYLNQLRSGGLAVINLETIIPVTVSSLGQSYPDDALLDAAVAKLRIQAVYVNGPAVAKALGEPKVANSVLIGALSRLLEGRATLDQLVPEALWLEVIGGQVPPRYMDLNRKAFLAGREAVLISTSSSGCR